MDINNLPIKITDKSIEEIITIIVNKITGKSSYQEILEQDIKPMYYELSKVHDYYLKIFSHFTREVYNGVDIDEIVQNLETCRIKHETIRRQLIVNINTITDNFDEKRKKNADPLYLFLIGCRQYFQSFFYVFSSILEGYNGGLKNSHEALKIYEKYKREPLKKRTHLSGFTETIEFAKQISNLSDEELKRHFLEEGFESIVNELRNNWDEVIKKYTEAERRITRPRNANKNWYN